MATAARQAGLQTVRADVLTRAGFAHGFSTRGGGVSVVYGGADGDLNVGYTQLDMREAVEENRRRLLMDVYGEALPMVTLTQVHGSETRRVGAGDVAMAQKADGMMTDERQIVLGIQTADCVPVLVADRETGAVAAFHAGWRGTVQGIVQSGVGRMCAEYGCRPGRLVAAGGSGRVCGGIWICRGVVCRVRGRDGAELPRSKGSESAATAGCRAGCGGDRGNAGVHGVCPGAFFFIPGGAGEYRKDAGGDSGATGESCGVGRACWWCLRVAGSAARRDSVG
jgi:hypothetical protein